MNQVATIGSIETPEAATALEGEERIHMVRHRFAAPQSSQIQEIVAEARRKGMR